ncbi:MAG: hypothetical protein AB7U83_17690 [Vicinamibacterales bacterium]
MTTALVAVTWGYALCLRRAGAPRELVVELASYTSVLITAAGVLGGPADLLFVALYRYHAYVPGDPMIDWIPFFPTDGWVVIESEGGRFINGGSPEQLTTAWRYIAVPVWCAAAVVTGLVVQLRERFRIGGPTGAV